MKNVVFFILLVLFCGFFTACDDTDDYVYETREVFYVANCQNSVSLRQYPSVKAKTVAEPQKHTELKSAVPYDNEWHKVTLSSGETGYILSKYIDSKTEQKSLRKKNYKDDLEEENQSLALFFIDLCGGKREFSVLFMLMTIILVFVCGCILLLHAFRDRRGGGWKVYALALLPNLCLIYVYFFTTYFYFDGEELDYCWILSIIIGILAILFNLFGVFFIWSSFVGAMAEVLDNSSKPRLQVKGNLVALSIVMVCAYWIEKLTDIAIIFVVIWNVAFLLFYLVYIIRYRGGLVRCFIVIVLTLVCLPPAIVCTILTLKLYFWIICGMLLLDVFFLGAPGALEGWNKASSFSNGSGADSEAKDYTEIDVPGEIGLRRIKHDNDWSGRDECGNRWEKNWDGTWSKK